MKKLLVAITVLVFTAQGQIAQADLTTSFSVPLVLPSIDDSVGYGTGVGFGPGVSLDFYTKKATTLQARADFSWQKWNNYGSEYNNDTETDYVYTRKPIFLGARLQRFAAGSGEGGIGLYLEAGLDISFDSIYTNGPYVDDDVTESSTNFGAAFGGGLVIALGFFQLNFGIRHHAIKDSYKTVDALGIGLRWGALARHIQEQ